MGMLVFYLLNVLLLFRNVKSADCGQYIESVQCDADPQCEWESNSASSCSSCQYGSESQCNNDNECSWSSGRSECDIACDLCTCKSAVPLDVIFVLDASGSVGEVNFDLQKAWLVYLFSGQISANSRVAFIIFATNVQNNLNPACNNGDVGPLCFWTQSGDCCNKQEMEDRLVPFVNGFVWTRGWTITQKAIEQALNWFNNYGDPLRKWLLILITDGQPNKPDGNYSVCIHTPFIIQLNVEVVVVGVGNGWTNQNGPQKVGCLVDNPDNMFFVPDFNSFASINDDFLKKLCPAINNVVITECKAGRSDNTDTLIYSFPNEANDNWRGRFLEIYNKGAIMNIEQLFMTGFVQFDTNGIEQANFPISSPVGTYVVFYEESSNLEDDISCFLCEESCELVKDCSRPTGYSYDGGDWSLYPVDSNCQSVVGDDIHFPTSPNANIDPNSYGGGRCWGTSDSTARPPAVYIPCPLCSVGYGTYGCCIDGTMDETNWNQEIYDIQVSTSVPLLLDTVTYGSDQDWPIPRDGFPIELTNKNYPNEAGANWQPACYEWGTPGTDPLGTCPPRCDDSSCISGGDTNADCSQSGTCICTSDYYANGIGCSKIPIVNLCSAHWLKFNATLHIMQYQWTPVLFANKEYILYFTDFDTGDETSVNALQQLAIDLLDTEVKWEGVGVPAGYIVVQVIDENGLPQESERVPCPVTTSPPTESPTPEPTISPTPAPTDVPTPSPTSGPRACFFKDCNERAKDLTNVDFCECGPNWLPLAQLDFDPLCCKYNETYQLPDPLAWGPNQLGSGVNTGEDFYCSLQTSEWVPREAPWPLRIGCTDAPEIKSVIQWRIVFWEALCVKRCELLTRRRMQRLNNVTIINGTVVDFSGFALYPLSGESVLNVSVVPPVVTELITVESVADPFDSVGTGSGGPGPELMSVYYAELLGCQNFGDGNPSCTVVYPNPVRIEIRRSAVCQGARCGDTKENKIPPYIWGVIGGLVAFLLLLAALIYLFWWKTAMAKENIADAKEQQNIEAAEVEDGLGANVGMGTHFNPLATGNANNEIPKDAVSNVIDNLNKNPQMEWAEVQDNKFQVRNAFGAQQGNASRFT